MIIENNEYLVFPCPNCQELTIVYKIDICCAIFRHGCFKDTYFNINPHLSQVMCQHLIKNELIYGCSKPFQILEDNGHFEVNKCDYI